MENAVWSLPELTDEYRIEVVSSGGLVERCMVVTEILPDAGDPARVAEKLRARLKQECLVTPEMRLVPAGTLQRTEFKVKRVVRLPAAGPAATAGDR